MKSESIKAIQRQVDSEGVTAPSHTSEMFNPDEFTRIVTKTVKKVRELRKLHPEIEALAACGQSGMMLMGAVSLLTGLPQIAVRKVKDSDYTSAMANGWMGCKGYLVLDDLVDSGRTLERIAKHIDDRAMGANMDNGFVNRPKMVAALLYRNYSNDMYRYAFDGEIKTVPLYALNAVSTNMEPGRSPRTSSAAYALEDKLRRQKELEAEQKLALDKNPCTEMSPRGGWPNGEVKFYVQKISGPTKSVILDSLGSPTKTEPTMTQADVAESWGNVKPADAVASLKKRLEPESFYSYTKAVTLADSIDFGVPKVAPLAPMQLPDITLDMISESIKPI